MRIERHVVFWLAALLVLVLAIGMLKDILLPFVVGIVLAYFLNPLAEKLSAMGLPRMAASALIVGSAGALVVTAVIVLAPLLMAQAQQFASTLPEEISRMSSLIETWARERLGAHYPEFQRSLSSTTDSIGENWANLAGWVAASLWDRSLAIFNFFTLLLVTPVVIFYLLIDWHPMLAKIDGWLPRDQAPVIRELADEINDAISAFIRGQGTVCLILGTFYALALSAIGLNYGLLVGIATGVMTFVPFVGWATGFMTAMALAVIQYWPEIVPIVLVAGVFLAGQGMDAAYLSPRIVGSKVGLHPVWLIFALFVFSYLFGLIGVLVAVPLAAAIGVLVRFALRVYLGSSFYRGRDTASDAALAPKEGRA